MVSDTGIPSPKHPALTYALRGIAAVEIIMHGPSRDLHSGIFGGSVDNPAMALAQLLAKLRDKNGRVTIPGFYADVLPLSAYERKQLARLPGTDSAYRKFLGVPKLFGENGFTPTEQRTSRPALEINGPLPAVTRAKAAGRLFCRVGAAQKLTMRLVPNPPIKIMKAARKYFPGLVSRKHPAGDQRRPWRGAVYRVADK